MEEWHTIWGRNIAAMRSARGLNREEFAEAVGVSVATVSRWESGKLGMTDARKLRIAEVLGTHVQVLFPLARGK